MSLDILAEIIWVAFGYHRCIVILCKIWSHRLWKVPSWFEIPPKPNVLIIAMAFITMSNRPANRASYVKTLSCIETWWKKRKNTADPWFSPRLRCSLLLKVDAMKYQFQGKCCICPQWLLITIHTHTSLVWIIIFGHWLSQCYLFLTKSQEQ